MVAAVTDEDVLAAELLRRQRGRDSLAHFALGVDIPGVPVVSLDPTVEAFKPIESRVALHHLVIMAAIQRCIQHPTGGRTMIFAPPGSAKSTYGSVVAPAWAMGKYPGSRYILGSYASDIAVKQSRKTRALCSQNGYTTIFKERPTLQADQRAADEWRLTNSSEYMAAGLLAGITGNRANGLIVDDPISNREAADSPTIRAKVHSEWVDTALTRLLPGGWALIIQTRWHELDLSGSILPMDYKGESGLIKCQDNQIWDILNIPAKAEHADDPLGRKIGEYLWPEWFPVTHWATWENNPNAARTWSALFQQRPSPGEGLQFRRADARWYDSRKAPGSEGGPPLYSRKFGASDYAVTADGGDFTEHGMAEIDSNSRLYITDWWSGQKESNVSINAMLAMVKRAKISKIPIARWFNEGGVIDKAIRPAINRAMFDENAYVTIETMTSIQNKSIKLESFHARYAAGQVYFPSDKPWGKAIVDQLVAFPTGKHDDKADVCGLFGRGIDQMGNVAIPVAEKKPELVPFTAKWLEYREDSDKPKIRFHS